MLYRSARKCNAECIAPLCDMCQNISHTYFIHCLKVTYKKKRKKKLASSSRVFLVEIQKARLP